MDITEVYPPLGYSAINKKLVVNKEESKIIEYIYEKYLDGNGYLTIAKMLNDRNIKTRSGSDFSANAIRFILMNKTYTGLMEWKGKNETISVEGQQEAIIDRATFNKVQERMKSNPRAHLRNWATNHLLSGVVKCEVCGSSMSNARVSSGGKIYHYYQCNQYSNKKTCKPNLIRKLEIEESFKKELRNILNENLVRDKIVEIIQDEQLKETFLDKRIIDLEKELTLLEKDNSKLISIIKDEGLTEESKKILVEDINKMVSKISDIEKNLKREKNKQKRIDRNKLDKKDIEKILNDFDKFLSVVDEKSARRLILELVYKVETKDKKLDKIYTNYKEVYSIQNKVA